MTNQKRVIWKYIQDISGLRSSPVSWLVEEFHTRMWRHMKPKNTTEINVKMLPLSTFLTYKITKVYDNKSAAQQHGLHVLVIVVKYNL
jgi:hypothetical protein